MGLAQVYGIVAQHGGHSSVTSEPGKGSVFVFSLPALDCGSNAAAAP
jgi:signal transduction histidine kinase